MNQAKSLQDEQVPHMMKRPCKTNQGLKRQIRVSLDKSGSPWTNQGLTEQIGALLLWDESEPARAGPRGTNQDPAR